MRHFRRAAFSVLAAVAALTSGCEQSMEQVSEALRVTLATQPAPMTVGEVVLKAEVTDAEGRALEGGARVRFLYWKAYKKIPSAPEEVVRESAQVVRDGDRTYQSKVKLEAAGAWKVSVKVERPDREPTAVTFTFDVRG
ncbi:MAG: hypothetical protein HY510_07780 [Acidobacteria bacterium]|nr:hypothetical protein [Acidobacteriota bacterium]